MKLTLPQLDIYFEQLLYPNDPIYNIGAKIEIKGNLNLLILSSAYVAMINQHETYRSVFIKTDDDVETEFVEDHDSELGYKDFSAFQNPIEMADDYMMRKFSIPFDLFNKEMLHSFVLIKLREDHYYLFSMYHHIITDGWGTSLMFQRLVQNYNEIFEFGEVKTKYPFSYQDFVEDDLEYQTSRYFAQDKTYWVKKFQSIPEKLFEKINGTVQINKSNRKELIIKRLLYNRLNELAAVYKCTTFHLFLALLYIYFGRKHENNDFGIGIPVLNRNKSIYKKTVGLFMGVSVLRIPLDFDATVENLINEIKNQLRSDYRHQRFPLGKLIQELQLSSAKERLFNITLSYEKQNYSNNFFNTQTHVIPLTHRSERVPLAIYIREFDEMEDVKIDFDYNLNYFNDCSITEVINHFENLLNNILDTPEKKLKELQYVTEEERLKILVGFNQANVDYPKDKTIIDLFEQQVRLTPAKEALKGDTKFYTYSELHKLSNQIAEYLITTFGAADRSPIAVLLGRNVDMVAVLLGILKSGRSYIPLDPDFPLDRLNYIIDDSQAKLLICDREYLPDACENLVVLKLESIFTDIDKFQGHVLTANSPHHTAYIIYTSGSTGNPKGVEIGHQSLLNFLISMKQNPGVNPDDTLFSVTTYSFDISILEFFAPLISGATLYIASQDVLSDPHLIIKKMDQVKPTLIQATPSFYQMLFNAGWQGNERLKVLCGGDLLSWSLAEKLINSCLTVWNMYGPTETTVWSSIKKIEQPSDASNIGKNINNTQFYILDKFLNPKPIGMPGAIYIAGDGLAKGYYKNDSLTNEKFIKNPFDSNTLCYKTGDVGKWNRYGEIEFLGRDDNQVKIRGYRIELGDIESQLNQIPAIKDSIVIAKREGEKEAFLVAYVLKNQEDIDTVKIGNQLKKALPNYMIPNAIIPLEEFPLTPNKKVDRKSLSLREIQHSTNDDDFKKPVSDLEVKLSEYWQEALNMEEAISLDDNFFALGGHSLNAVKLVGSISRNLSVEINLKTIFDYPSIESLANYLKEQKTAQSNLLQPSEIKDLYHLTPAQYAIWLASQQTRNSLAYNMSAGYRVDGAVDTQKINESINQIISRYEILRTNFIEIEGIPYQKINPARKIRFEVFVHQLRNDNIEETIDKFINTEFDLEKDLLIRVQFIPLEKNQHLLLFSTHHIVMDGLSLEIFVKEFIENYNGNTLNITRENILQFQFRDYSEWLHKTIKENQSANELFWKNYLQNYTFKDSFDMDFNIQNNNQNGSQLLFELQEEVTLHLKRLAIEKQMTLYTLIATSINVLIYKLSNHFDICIGTVNSGRNTTGLEDQIGMFAKTVVLRTQIRSEQTFADLLESVNSNILEIMDYSDIPFDKMPPILFDAMLVYQNMEFTFETGIELNELKLTSYPTGSKFSRMPVVFNFFETAHHLKGVIDYNSDLYKKDTIQMIVSEFIKIVSEISINPLVKLEAADKPAQEINTTLDFNFNF